jgi:hypothetical protein
MSLSAANRSSARGAARRIPSGTSTPTARAARSTSSAAVAGTQPETGSARKQRAQHSVLPVLLRTKGEARFSRIYPPIWIWRLNGSL